MNEHIENRNAAFMREFQRQKRKAYADGEMPMVEELVRRASRAEAPAYYIDFDYAMRHVNTYVRHPGRYTGRTPNSRSGRRRMIEEIALKAQALVEQKPGLRLRDAVARVLAFERASSFFISETYGVRLYYRIAAATHRRQGRLRSRHLF